MEDTIKLNRLNCFLSRRQALPYRSANLCRVRCNVRALNELSPLMVSGIFTGDAESGLENLINNIKTKLKDQ